MRAAPFVLLAGLVGVFGVQPTTVRAEDAASGGEAYAQLIGEAVREFDAANYVEAHTLFERAYARKPNARTLRGLGYCSYELKHYVRAVQELQAALAENRNPLTTAQHAEVSATLAKAQRFVGKLVLDVQPAGASVEVDGRPVEASEQALDIDAGDHTLAASASGYRGSEQRVTVEGGQTVHAKVRLLQLDLRPERVASSSQQTPSSQPLVASARETDGDPSLFSRWWFWTAAVVVVGGAVAGTLIALNSGDEQAAANKGTTDVLLKAP